MASEFNYGVPLSPNQVLVEYEKDIGILAASLIEGINGILKSNYRGEPIKMGITWFGETEDVKIKVIKAFQDNGWDIEFVKDRKGDHYMMSEKL